MTSPSTPDRVEMTLAPRPEFIDTRPQMPAVRLYAWGAGGNTEHTFQDMRRGLSASLRRADTIHRGKWQTLDVSASGMHTTRELRNVSLFYTVPATSQQLAEEVQPDLPWAEQHFQERVGGEPLNPAPSYKDWPHHNGQMDRHIDKATFSHTYPERFWPKFANVGNTRPNGRQVFVPHNGIRFEFGDLDGVINQLVENPLTRQAVLPVWFPEDTGQTTVRVPCTLTYHFMADADMRLSVWYSMRACDFVRHFHNDAYMAARLLQWVVFQVNATQSHLEMPLTVGEVNMTISSLHVFEGDIEKLPA